VLAAADMVQASVHLGLTWLLPRARLARRWTQACAARSAGSSWRAMTQWRGARAPMLCSKQRLGVLQHRARLSEAARTGERTASVPAVRGGSLRRTPCLQAARPRCLLLWARARACGAGGVPARARVTPRRGAPGMARRCRRCRRPTVRRARPPRRATPQRARPCATPRSVHGLSRSAQAAARPGASATSARGRRARPCAEPAPLS